MIFLRQKHFSYANSNHRARNSNRGQSRVLNRYPTLASSSSSSSRPAALNPNLIRLASSAYAPTTNINNTNSAINVNSTQTSTNNSNINSNQNINYTRSVKINERLASIGGLFGVLSIVITGALLYAIFTANNEDKLYYIIAVLINVSLLVILMISAILFDRFYLKKLSNSNTSNLQTTITANNNSSIRPSSNTDEENNLASTLNLLNAPNFRLYNDVPPRYPGIIEQNETVSSNTSNNNSSTTVNNSHSPILQSSIILVNPIKTNNTSLTRKTNNTSPTSNNNNNTNNNNIYNISSQLNNDRLPSAIMPNRSSMNHHSSYIPSTFNVYLDPNSNSQYKNELIVDDKNLKTIASNLNANTTVNSAKNVNIHPPPPNYFDLYPLKENDTLKEKNILNQNVHTVPSNHMNNNGEQAILPSTSTTNRSSNIDD
jgi:hypothetical protein